MSAQSEGLITSHNSEPPGPRIWTALDLVKFLRVSVHWVRKRMEKLADDPLPRMPGFRQIRIDTSSPKFRAWLNRQLGNVNNEGSDE